MRYPWVVDRSTQILGVDVFLVGEMLVVSPENSIEKIGGIR